jgi:hypothetical protein
MHKIRKLKKGECKDISTIEIQFENCEVFSIDRKDISNFYLHNIRKNISICINAAIEDNEAEDIWIVIPEENARKKYKTFGFGSEESLIDRLGIETKNPIRDITHIYIKYNTNEEECYSCVWEGDSDYDNPAQKCYIDKEKSGQTEKSYLIISISKDNL